MTDGDYLVKPVEGLQNMPALGPVKRREQRRHRQQQHKSEPRQETPEAAEEEESTGDRTESKEDQQHGIDYCA